MEAYVGQQFVGVDLHRRRTVIVRQTPAGQRLGTVRIDNDPFALAEQVAGGVSLWVLSSSEAGFVRRFGLVWGLGAEHGV